MLVPSITIFLSFNLLKGTGIVVRFLFLLDTFLFFGLVSDLVIDSFIFGRMTSGSFSTIPLSSVTLLMSALLGNIFSFNLWNILRWLFRGFSSADLRVFTFASEPGISLGDNSIVGLGERCFFLFWGEGLGVGEFLGPGLGDGVGFVFIERVWGDGDGSGPGRGGTGSTGSGTGTGMGEGSI